MNKPKIDLHITFDQDNGRVMIAGPVENKVLCYGLLGAAFEALMNFNSQTPALKAPTNGNTPPDLGIAS